MIKLSQPYIKDNFQPILLKSIKNGYKLHCGELIQQIVHFAFLFFLVWSFFGETDPRWLSKLLKIQISWDYHWFEKIRTYIHRIIILYFFLFIEDRIRVGIYGFLLYHFWLDCGLGEEYNYKFLIFYIVFFVLIATFYAVVPIIVKIFLWLHKKTHALAILILACILVNIQIIPFKDLGMLKSPLAGNKIFSQFKKWIKPINPIFFYLSFEQQPSLKRQDVMQNWINNLWKFKIFIEESRTTDHFILFFRGLFLVFILVVIYLIFIMNTSKNKHAQFTTFALFIALFNETMANAINICFMYFCHKHEFEFIKLNASPAWNHNKVVRFIFMMYFDLQPVNYSNMYSWLTSTTPSILEKVKEMVK